MIKLIKKQETQTYTRLVYLDENGIRHDHKFAIEVRNKRHIVVVKDFNGGIGGIIHGYINGNRKLSPSAFGYVNFYVARYSLMVYLESFLKDSVPLETPLQSAKVLS